MGLYIFFSRFLTATLQRATSPSNCNAVIPVKVKVVIGKCTGVNFVDSTPMRVCRNQRILCHKVFKGIAMRGKCSLGWFFGFKSVGAGREVRTEDFKGRPCL